MSPRHCITNFWIYCSLLDFFSFQSLLKSHLSELDGTHSFKIFEFSCMFFVMFTLQCHVMMFILNNGSLPVLPIVLKTQCQI